MAGFAIIVVISFIIGFAIMQLAKFLLRKFCNNKPNEKLNPYIEYHKLKMQNDNNYDDYLEWTKNKEVFGSIVEKVEAPEETEASVKVMRLVPKRKFNDDDKLF